MLTSSGSWVFMKGSKERFALVPGEGNNLAFKQACPLLSDYSATAAATLAVGFTRYVLASRHSHTCSMWVLTMVDPCPNDQYEFPKINDPADICLQCIFGHFESADQRNP